MLNSGNRETVAGIYRIAGPKGRFYIGSSLDVHKRWNDHRYHLHKGTHHCQQLQRAYDKYSLASFSFDLLHCCAADSETLLKLEQQYIDTAANNKLYNSSVVAGRPISEPLSLEHRNKISVALTGRTKNEETRARMSAYAMKRTSEHRDKLIQALIGKKATPETKAKQRAAKIGKTLTPEHIAKVRETLIHSVRKDNKTGYRGVSIDRGRYVARIKRAGTYKNLGRFQTPEEANAAILGYEIDKLLT